MWALISKKVGAFFGFVALALVLFATWKRQGRDEANLKNEKVKSKEQEVKHEKQTEILKKVKDVENKNVLAPDSTIISRLRDKWQRD